MLCIINCKTGIITIGGGKGRAVGLQPVAPPDFKSMLPGFKSPLGWDFFLCSSCL